MPPNPFRTGYVATEADGAALTFTKADEARWSLHYNPAPQAIRIAERDPDFSLPPLPILLIQADVPAGFVVTYPLNTTATSRTFLRPKYSMLRTITFAGRLKSWEEINAVDDVQEFLRNLPAGFVRDPYFGLGINWELRYVVDALEDVEGIGDLKFRGGSSKGLPLVDGSSYALSYSMFDRMRKAINNAHSKALDIAQDEKRVFTHNTLLTSIDPMLFPQKFRRYRNNAIVEAIGGSLRRTVRLSDADSDAVVLATKTAAKRLSNSKPGQLLELSREIELVTLETLITKLDERLKKKLSEPDWQNFFTDNPFVLRMAFGYPVMVIAGQVSVGGRKLDGSGEKVTDFAVKAMTSGNLSLIEIKTPSTPLLEAKEYRGGVFAPSRDLAGAVNQVLDQRYQLQKSIAQIKDNSEAWDIESYAVQCLVIAGSFPSSRHSQKSFELYRNSMKSVTIITFDELSGKLKHLLEFLRGPTESAEKTEVVSITEEAPEDAEFVDVEDVEEDV